MKWYFEQSGVASGPHDLAALAALIASGSIGRDTLVWVPGMPAWEAAGASAALEGYFSPAPPPLPVPPPLSELRPVRLDAPPPPVSSAETPAEIPAEIPAEPWARFFARLFDTALFSLIVVNGLAVLADGSETPLARAYQGVDDRIVTIASLVAVALINALMTALFGNTPGKALFGIRVRPLNGRRRLNLLQALAREFRIWWFGLGIGIPLIAPFTIWTQFQRLSEGRPTGYDAGRSMVISRGAGRTRQSLAFGLTLVVVAAIGALNYFGDTDKPAKKPLTVSDLRRTSAQDAQDRQAATDAPDAPVALETSTPRPAPARPKAPEAPGSIVRQHAKNVAGKPEPDADDKAAAPPSPEPEPVVDNKASAAAAAVAAPDADAGASSIWTNPITGEAVGLPGFWVAVPPDGSTIPSSYAFVDAHSGRKALLFARGGAGPVAPADLDRMLTAFRDIVPGGNSIGEWSRSPAPPYLWSAQGRSRDNHPVSYYLGSVYGRFWGVMFEAERSDSANGADDPALAASLFNSAGLTDGFGPLPQPPSP